MTKQQWLIEIIIIIIIAIIGWIFFSNSNNIKTNNNNSPITNGNAATTYGSNSPAITGDVTLNVTTTSPLPRHLDKTTKDYLDSKLSNHAKMTIQVCAVDDKEANQYAKEILDYIKSIKSYEIMDNICGWGSAGFLPGLSFDENDSEIFGIIVGRNNL